MTVEIAAGAEVVVVTAVEVEGTVVEAEETAVEVIAEEVVDLVTKF
jgi:hypothetical protein